MTDMQQIADSMLSAAGTVYGRLIDQQTASSKARRNDHDGSIRTDGDELITIAELPALGAQIVVRFSKPDMQRIVAAMLGEGEEPAEFGPMQLSIASETVSQIASAMVEQLAKDIGASTEGIHAALCTDATLLPPPPFESFDGGVQIGTNLTSNISIDFAAITLSKLGLAGAHADAPAATAAAAKAATPSPAAAAASNAQSVSFSAMQPTTVRTAQAGQANLDLVHDVPLQVRAVLGKTVMPLREVVSLQTGTVFELDKLSAEPIDLYVNNILIARGEVVVVDDKYAVKISELNPQLS